jgi:hypothetical protein
MTSNAAPLFPPYNIESSWRLVPGSAGGIYWHYCTHTLHLSTAYTNDLLLNRPYLQHIVSKMLLMQSQYYDQCCGAGAASFWLSRSRSRIAMLLLRLLFLNWYSKINCCLKVRLT